jgi:hypothetical protein
MRVDYKVSPELWSQVDAFTAAHRALLNQPTHSPSPMINEDEADLIGRIIGIPAWVQFFMSGHRDALNWLARYSRSSGRPSLGLSADLFTPSFLERLASVMRDDPRSSDDALCLAQNLWWASSDPRLYADCLIDSVILHLITEHSVTAFSAAANFAADSPDHARLLLDRSIVSSIVGYFAAHPRTHSEARHPLRLILSLYQKLDKADFPQLAPVARDFIAYIPDRWHDCRPRATYCALAMLTSDADDDVAADAVDALVNAQLLFVPRQVEPLAKAFRLVIARGLYHLIDKAYFFEGLARTLDHADGLEDHVFRDVAGVGCDVMAVDGDALLVGGILGKVVAICDAGRGVLRVPAGAALAQALVASPVDVCGAVVETGALAALLGVVGCARPPDLGVMLQAIARMVREREEWRQIVRDSDFCDIGEELDTEDQQSFELIDLILQELDA